MTSNAPENPARSTPPSEPRLWLSLLDEAVFTGLPLTTNSAYLTLRAALAAAAAAKQPGPAPEVPPPYKMPLRQERVEKFGGHYWRVVDSDGREVDDASIRELAVGASRLRPSPHHCDLDSVGIGYRRSPW